MLFKRREPLPTHRRLGQLVWPRSGWRRAATYVAHRVGRLPGTPYKIAAGFACGAAISFTPVIGFHFIGASLLAILLRGNIIASAIGTAVGNPWTFPFIWLWTFKLGTWILSMDPVHFSPVKDLAMSDIVEDFWGVFIPMLVGGIPTAIAAWFLVFFPAQRLVEGYQTARRRRLRRKARRRQEREVAAAARRESQRQRREDEALEEKR